MSLGETGKNTTDAGQTLRCLDTGNKICYDTSERIELFQHWNSRGDAAFHQMKG